MISILRQTLPQANANQSFPHQIIAPFITSSLTNHTKTTRYTALLLLLLLLSNSHTWIHNHKIEIKDRERERDGFTKPVKRRVVGFDSVTGVDAHRHMRQLSPFYAPRSLPIPRSLQTPHRSDRRRPLPRRRRIGSRWTHHALRSTHSQ